jgi:glucose-6-phosphate isomerase
MASPPIPPAAESEAWRALAAHRQAIAAVHMRALFAEDPRRFDQFSLGLGDFLLDYSKNRLTDETVRRLLDLARAADVEGWRERMFRGEAINATEDRAVLHVALRNRSNRPIRVNGADVMPAVNGTLARMRDFAAAVRGGAWKGHTGKPVADVVNIGIGGSDLGPAMACEALAPYHQPGLRVHFVSNVDGTHLAETLKPLDPSTTLFLVASKTFTTQETLANAASAKTWLTRALGAAATPRHFVALSANAAAAQMFGIDPDHTLPFWDWVGGRYSLWSSVGLSIALAVGMDRFEELLAGAHTMDEHFRAAPLDSNLPTMLALVGVWNASFLGAESCAVLPFDQHLHRFPAFLQQLEMESNGKSVTRDGRLCAWPTAPVVFGEPGTNGQHAFYQLLHQGTRLVAADFIAAVTTHNPLGDHHDLLIAHFLAQTEALMKGKTEAEARSELEAEGMSGKALERLLPHKVFPGNRPTNSILYRRLDPYTLGMLIALYEHKVFVQGVIWNVNSFDQWGVELGKQLAGHILPRLTGTKPVGGDDSSTVGLIRRYREWKAKGP